MGNLLKEGAVNVTDADALPAVADPIVGATGELLAPEALAPRIGIRLFYLTLFNLIINLSEHF